MTAQEARNAYIARFGGFPEFLFMGAADAEIVSAVKKAIEAGKEIEAPDSELDY